MWLPATLLLGGHEVGGIGGYPEDVAAEAAAAWSTYFGTFDTDDAVARATAHGGFVIRPPAGTPTAGRRPWPTTRARSSH